MNNWEELLEVDWLYEVELNTGSITTKARFLGVSHPSGKPWLVFEKDGMHLLRNPSYVARCDVVKIAEEADDIFEDD